MELKGCQAIKMEPNESQKEAKRESKWAKEPSKPAPAAQRPKQKGGPLRDRGQELVNYMQTNLDEVARLHTCTFYFGKTYKCAVTKSAVQESSPSIT